MRKFKTLLLGLLCMSLSMFCSNANAQCSSDCEIQCVGQVNVSLSQECTANITPAMGGVGIEADCNDYYTVNLYSESGSPLPTTIVDHNHVNQTLTYKITEPECGNSCWGTLNIEYKLAPVIDCPENITVNCAVVDFLCEPTIGGAGCLDVLVDITLIDEVESGDDCDPMFQRKITRTYQACDEFGNCNTCSYEIAVERIDLTDIKFPESLTVGNNTAISCCDETIQYDEDGFPIPWLFDPMTGSGSGVPVYCVPPPTGSGSYADVGICIDGMLPFTGSGSAMVPLVPGNNNICNTFVSYTDIEFEKVGCVRKIMRTWNVREWWCSDEITTGDIQLIEIVDDQAPEIVCPADFTVSTDFNCSGSVNMPSVQPFDKCGSEVTVKIEHPNGLYTGDGGPINLNLGYNLVTYIASDECYNQSSCQVNVTVRDNTNPVAICETTKVVSISQSSNTIVFAEPFDNGSWDECGLDRFEVRRMVDDYCVEQDTLFGSHVTFCCSDVGRSDVMVVFRAVDKSGNFNECMVAVEVQDKSIPGITCPPDMTIDCREPYDLNNLSLTFGAPEVGSGCALTNLVETPITDLDQCGTGAITRKFEILDGEGNAARNCVQQIYIQNNQPFYATDIIWPLDYVTQDICDVDNLNPESLPAPHDVPTFVNNDNCSLLAYDYEDKVFRDNLTSGACAVIERTWTVINWCGDSNSDGQFDQFVIPRPQRIEVINTSDPVIEETGPLTFTTQNIDCSSGPIQINMTATDDCNNIHWRFVLRASNGDTVIYGDSSYVATNLLVGDYNIEWVAFDGCGNSDVYNQPIEVKNNKIPTPVCLNGLSANLVLMDLDSNGIFDAEMVELWASDFDGGSSHSCGNPVVLSFSQDTSDKVRIFDCNHIGINPIQMWVTDVESGLQDFCSTFIDIQDNNGMNVCEPQDGLRAVVSGDVITENQETVDAVEVSLIQNAIIDTTDASGEYAFPSMPLGGNYQLTPKKDIDYLNGVSTLDIIVIQRHILGNELLDSPYKLIAADANNDQQVSAIDLIELRKLILGIYDELPNNDSWRFVDAEYEFMDPINPWLNDYPERYIITNLNQDMDIDFVGVKIGDVNGSAIANAKGNNIEKRSNQSLEIRLANSLNSESGLMTVPVYANNYTDISGLQFTLEFDPAIVEFLDINSAALKINADLNLGLSQLSKGLIAVSYSNTEAQTFDSEEVLFELVFTSNETIDLLEALEINSANLRAEAYDKDLNILSINLIDNQEEISRIANVTPNPWLENANIQFTMSKADEAKLEFYNVDGQLLHTKKGFFSKGMNTLNIQKSDINANGVIYVKLISGDKISEYKMIVL